VTIDALGCDLDCDLDRDLDDLVRTLDDAIEAEALRELMALAAELEIEPNEDADDYTPFVYPH
jgi:hypothetical protein